MITGRVGACGGCVQGAMRPSKKADLKYSFEWTEFEFYPAKCSSQKSRLPRVVIQHPDEKSSILFPEYYAAAKKITLTAFPEASLNGKRVPDGWFGDSRSWTWPNTESRIRFPEQGFFWMDVKLNGRPPFMGWLHKTKTEARSVRKDYQLDTTDAQSLNFQYMVELRDHALKAAAEDQTEGSASKAFLEFAIQKPCPTSATRAYLVDWALAERRTGLSFESMEAFEEWAAQQGLAVLGVVDAASASASESESEE